MREMTLMVMDIWNKLFKKTPNVSDLRVQFKEIEREQKKKRRDLEMAEVAKTAKLREAVKAKKDGKSELQRDIFRELRQMEINRGHMDTELRQLSLSKTALTRFIRQIERLEKRKDRKSLQSIILRFKESDLQAIISKAEVDDDTFNDVLEEILGDEELEVTGGKLKEDSGFAEFDRALEQMVRAEESGSEDDVAKIQAEIDRAVRADRDTDSER
ncbi:MAG TPA: hypothetical protein VN700_07920 [Vicinamibacterales bacterium]|nr:hypothetical protein [Vicinamibacterales bacterium]